MILAAGILLLCTTRVVASDLFSVEAFKTLAPLFENHCIECHDTDTAKGGLDLTKLSQELNESAVRERWIRIHDRIEKHEMPPKKQNLPESERLKIIRILSPALLQADRKEVATSGRGPLRRLNRDEYQNNLRDLLHLPNLDIRDMLPEDREGHHFNKSAQTLDMSRVQLTAYLDTAETALMAALAGTPSPPTSRHIRIVGTDLFPSPNTFGNREAMFFARDNKGVVFPPKPTPEETASDSKDESLELALFRSPNWPYYGYPKGFFAPKDGEYKIRFSARAVRQLKDYVIVPADAPQPMTFRARRPSGPDVSGDVRSTGGLIDIQPERSVYETNVILRKGETFEYSLLGLPVPLAFNIKGGAPTYRYPPFPPDGQPGAAFQWLEIDGPLSPESWPPVSHKVLFDEIPVGQQPSEPKREALRLMRRFATLAVREPISEKELDIFNRLVLTRVDKGEPFQNAILAGYQALLCSGHFLYLRQPNGPDDFFAIAARLSHFLTNTRPDERMSHLASEKMLRKKSNLRTEAVRLIEGPGFDHFVRNFTAYWLNLRHIRRDDPDIRLYPEYRFDDYLVESMEMETRAFFSSMIRENWEARVLVDADFVFANDRLSRHYQAPPLSGSAMRKVTLSKGSPYGGLLTQASILKVTANGTTTSPVVRGAWVMERLLGLPPPPPPPSVPAVEPDIRGAKTIRELLAFHTKDQACAACHAKFDPIGVALENFDILGGWRTRYRGVEEGDRISGIDRAGHEFAYTLSASVDASGKILDGPAFQNIHELKAILASNPRQLGRNLLHQFVIYATGTPVRFSDRPEIEAILDSCAGGGFRVRDLLMAFIESKIFLGPAGAQ
jgi:hypothetical protein